VLPLAGELDTAVAGRTGARGVADIGTGPRVGIGCIVVVVVYFATNHNLHVLSHVLVQILYLFCYTVLKLLQTGGHCAPLKKQITNFEKSLKTK